MKTNYGDKTHGCDAVPPQQFRDQATGIGQTRAGSAATGAMRTAKVNATMPKKARRALPMEGNGGY